MKLEISKMTNGQVTARVYTDGGEDPELFWPRQLKAMGEALLEAHTLIKRKDMMTFSVTVDLSNEEEKK